MRHQVGKAKSAEKLTTEGSCQNRTWKDKGMGRLPGLSGWLWDPDRPVPFHGGHAAAAREATQGRERGEKKALFSLPSFISCRCLPWAESDLKSADPGQGHKPERVDLLGTKKRGGSGVGLWASVIVTSIKTC